MIQEQLRSPRNIRRFPRKAITPPRKPKRPDRRPAPTEGLSLALRPLIEQPTFSSPTLPRSCSPTNHRPSASYSQLVVYMFSKFCTSVNHSWMFGSLKSHFFLIQNSSGKLNHPEYPIVHFYSIPGEPKSPKGTASAALFGQNRAIQELVLSH